MITSIIGRKFLKAYNEKFKTSYSPKEFFLEVYYPLFFDSNKYMQWVQNSPFVQMKKGQKVELLTEKERKEKLDELILKIDKGYEDASVAIGFPASEEKEYATTSGQLSNMQITHSKDDIYLSWIGSSLGIGLQGGISILFDNKQILLDLYEGWIIYRKILNSNNNLKGNQINTWNGQWLSHKYDKMFIKENPMANFNPFSPSNPPNINTQSWTKVLIGISENFNNPQMIGYVYNFGQTNTTIGFIPFALDQIRRPIELYKKLFGMDSGHRAELLWGTRFGLSEGCKKGVIGLNTLEPKGLRIYIDTPNTKNGKVKIPKSPNNDEQQIVFNIYKTWIMAMLNNEQLWAKAQEFAKELQTYALNSERGKKVNSNKINAVLEATNKSNFIKSLAEIAYDTENKDEIESVAAIVNMMPSDNVPYFLTLIRFHYAITNNIK